MKKQILKTKTFNNSKAFEKWQDTITATIHQITPVTIPNSKEPRIFIVYVEGHSTQEPK